MRYAVNGELFVNARGGTLIAIPETMFTELCVIRDERSAELTARKENLHGLPFLTHQEKYGDNHACPQCEQEGKARDHA